MELLIIAIIACAVIFIIKRTASRLIPKDDSKRFYP